MMMKDKTSERWNEERPADLALSNRCVYLSGG